MSSEDLNATISDSKCSDQDTPQLNTSSLNPVAKEHGRWTEKEHLLFLEGIMLYQNEWKNVQNHIKTRSATQARSHAQKFFIKMRKELLKKCSSLNEIKDSICSEFSKQLDSKFRPKNKVEFVESMMKLIFTNEKNFPFSNDSVTCVSKQQSVQLDEDKEQVSNEQDDDNTNTFKEGKIFCISKENSRRNSLNIQNDYAVNNGNGSSNKHVITNASVNSSSHMNAGTTIQLAKKFHTTPNNNPWINIVTVHVINNNPNYSSNLKKVTNSEHKGNSNSNNNNNYISNANYNNIAEDLSSNPFTLVNFDQIMDIPQNVNTQDDLFNNEILSLLNFKN